MNIQIQSWSEKIATILQGFQSWSCPCSPLVARVTVSDSDSTPVQKLLNPDPSPEIFQFSESVSCSDSGYQLSQPKFTHAFTRKITRQTPATAEIEKWLWVRCATLGPVMLINRKLDISYKLDISHILSTFPSLLHQKTSWSFATSSFSLVNCLLTVVSHLKFSATVNVTKQKYCILCLRKKKAIWSGIV